jgi:malate dehydrogenase (oxaloacetate-decarboxylating)
MEGFGPLWRPKSFTRRCGRGCPRRRPGAGGSYDAAPLASPSVSAQFSVTVRVELDARQEPLGKLTAQIAEAGGALQGVDLVPGAGGEGKRVREFTIDARDQAHWEEIMRAIGSTRGAKVLEYTDRTLAMHRGGKIEQHNRFPLKTRDDLSMAYTPGVARVCMEIAGDRSKAFDFTIKKNTVAVVSDGSAVLGLGDIGPEAAMPVMEGKAMLFKEFAGIDAFPICLDTNDPERIVEVVKLIAPTFGGVNLEDISAPRCFAIEDRLKDEIDIPVFHDDQHGTAVVTMAALFNSLKIVGKPIESLSVLMLGLGAAGVAVTKMMLASGVTNIIGCDRKGAVSTQREDYLDESMSPTKRWYAENSNPEGRLGPPAEVIEGADLFVGVSGPGLITAEDLSRMADDAIVFAMANPTPEVMPEQAEPYVRIMATGRSDYPNQINNVLCFPGIFRGALDAGAPRITEEMKLAAANGIADVVQPEDLSEDYIIPSVFDRDVAPAVARAVVDEARRAGIARVSEETGTFAAIE